jgi:hypothetical protein
MAVRTARALKDEFLETASCTSCVWRGKRRAHLGLGKVLLLQVQRWRLRRATEFAATAEVADDAASACLVVDRAAGAAAAASEQPRHTR